MADGTVVVFGATGHVGGVIAGRLLAAGRKVRLVARNADRLQPLARLGAEAAAADVTDAASVGRALRGAEAAFLLSPPPTVRTGIRAYQDRVGRSLAEAVRAAGTPRVALISSVGADQAEGGGPISGIHQVEERLAAVPGLAALFLRPGPFFENHLESIGMIKGMGKMGGALRADLRMPQIATRDIGEAAARRLLALDWKAGEVMELQGQRDLTPAEAAAAVGRAIGKPELEYVTFPYPDAEKGMVQAGLPPELAALYVEMARGFNEGRLRTLQPRSPATTTPTSIEAWAAEVFAPAYRG
jgi:uncharacterized protein YbjT (DUF2867 family)